MTAEHCEDCGCERSWAGRSPRCEGCRRARRNAQSRVYGATARAQPERRAKARETARAWRAANPERAREATRAWQLANPERMRSLARSWYRAHRADQLAVFHARRAAAAGVAVYEVSARDWRRLLEAKVCAYCGAGGPTTIEHVVPIIRGGSHSIGNLVAACEWCNRSKHHRLLTEWRGRVAQRVA